METRNLKIEDREKRRVQAALIVSAFVALFVLLWAASGKAAPSPQPPVPALMAGRAIRMVDGRVQVWAAMPLGGAGGYNSTPNTEFAVFKSIWDSSNGALRVRFALASNPNAGGNPTTTVQILKNAYDSTNGAIYINCVAGCANASTLGSVYQTPVTGWSNTVIRGAFSVLRIDDLRAPLIPACSSLRKVNCKTQTFN